MSTAKQRATAAKQAYKNTMSPNGRYSYRAGVKAAYGGKVARQIGKSLARSAAKPGKNFTTVNVWGRPAHLIQKKSAMNFHKLSGIEGKHVTLGEVQGVARNLDRTYRANMRKLTATAKKTARNS